MIILRNVPFKKVTVQNILRLIAEEKVWNICLYYDFRDVLMCNLEGDLEDEIELIKAQEQNAIPLPEMKIRLNQVPMELLPLQEIISLVERRKIRALLITIYSNGRVTKYDLELEANRKQIEVADLLASISDSITPTPTPLPPRFMDERYPGDSPIPPGIVRAIQNRDD